MNICVTSKNQVNMTNSLTLFIHTIFKFLFNTRWILCQQINLKGNSKRLYRNRQEVHSDARSRWPHSTLCVRSAAALWTPGTGWTADAATECDCCSRGCPAGSIWCRRTVPCCRTGRLWVAGGRAATPPAPPATPASSCRLRAWAGCTAHWPVAWSGAARWCCPPSCPQAGDWTEDTERWSPSLSVRLEIQQSKDTHTSILL